jgi:hypothetical protein
MLLSGRNADSIYWLDALAVIRHLVDHKYNPIHVAKRCVLNLPGTWHTSPGLRLLGRFKGL